MSTTRIGAGLSPNATRLFHIAAARDGELGTVLEGSDQLIGSAAIDPGSFTGAGLLVVSSIVKRFEVTCARLVIAPADHGRRIVIEVTPRIPLDRLVGGTVMVDERLVPPPPAPASTIVVVDANAAAAGGLPPLGVRFDHAGTPMSVDVLAGGDSYVRASGPPGAPLLFDVRATSETSADAAAVERAMRAALRDEGELEILDRSSLQLAGASREAVVVLTKRWQETSWLGAIVVARTGAVLVLAAAAFGPGNRPTVAQVAGARALSPLLRTLVVEGATPPPSLLAATGAESVAVAVSEPRTPRDVKTDGLNEVRVAAEAAAQRGLPRVGIRIDARGTPMSIGVFPDPGCYVRASGPPGGTLLVEITPMAESGDDVAAIERALAARFAAAWAHPREVYARGRIVLAGAERDAVACTTGTGFAKVAWAGAIVRTATTGVLVVVGVSAGEQRPTVKQIVEHPALASMVRSIAIDGAVQPARPAPSMLAARMAAESGAPPSPTAGRRRRGR